MFKVTAHRAFERYGMIREVCNGGGLFGYVTAAILNDPSDAQITEMLRL